MVVVAIIGILSSLLLHGLARAKGRAQSTLCQNNLKQIQLPWEIYAGDYDGHIVLNQEAVIAGEPFTVNGWVTGNAQSYISDGNLRGGLLWPSLNPTFATGRMHGT
jgi:type II secretory pathway pseudopilin PulG